MERILERIDSPQDLKGLSLGELEALAAELREEIITVVSQNGGHLAPNLGVVELSLALHYVFDTPTDKIIWDVGHQAYAHKLITGRRDRFHTLRRYRGISGFPKREESPYDSFGTGHASTSISAGLGMAKARNLMGEDHKIIAIIGDGALTAGLAFEGLNNVGASETDIIVVLNDNRMSISPSVGAFSKYLTNVLTVPAYNRLRAEIWDFIGKLPEFGEKIQTAVRRFDESLKGLVLPGIFFEELGFRYIGPLDGHDLPLLIKTLEAIRGFKEPILFHILTKKGKGYKHAEENLPKFHGLGAFDKITGEVKKSVNPSYSQVFGQTLERLAEKDERIVAITAAMSLGTGLEGFSQKFPQRFYDVGIAEQHAVTFAAGLATQGLRPVVAIYSTFLQRAYDQIVHDVALQRLPVVFAVDRGGLVGEDGPTHHGTFDLSFLRGIPNMVLMAPKDENEFRQMLYTALRYEKGPVAVRYPRGYGLGLPWGGRWKRLRMGSWEKLREGDDLVILAVGSMVHPSLRAAESLTKWRVGVVNCRFVKPMDTNLLQKIGQRAGAILTVEDNSLLGGFGGAVLEAWAGLGLPPLRIERLGIPDRFIEHGARDKLLSILGLDEKGIAERAREILEGSR